MDSCPTQSLFFVSEAEVSDVQIYNNAFSERSEFVAGHCTSTGRETMISLRGNSCPGLASDKSLKSRPLAVSYVEM